MLQLMLSVLLFVDNTALCSLSPAGPQRQLDTLQLCYQTWLSINISKI